MQRIRRLVYTNGIDARECAQPLLLLQATRRTDADAREYEVQVPTNAYYIVMCKGCTCCGASTDGLWNNGFIGVHGHAERANAWTHFVSCIVCCTYAVVRVVAWAHTTTAPFAFQLQGVSVATIGTMFAMSVVFHVYTPVAKCAVVVRVLDHSFIYAAMAVGALTDLSIVPKDFTSVPLQTIADPLATMFVLTVFFVMHGAVVPRIEMASHMFAGKAPLGLFRYLISDLEHADLRTAGTAVLTLSWILLAPSAFYNLRTDAAVVWTVAITLATLLLALGIYLDNNYVTDRMIARTPDGQRAPVCACASTRLGCYMSAHAWWHVLAFVSTGVLVAAREYAIQHLR